MPFSHQNYHIFGVKVWHFQGKITALLGAKCGGFGDGNMVGSRKPIDRFWKND